MRHAPFLAIPLLTLALGAIAQQAAPVEPRTALINDNQPLKLRAEPPPAEMPSRLVLNRSKSEFRIQVQQLKLEDAAATASTTPQLESGLPLPPNPGVPAVVDASVAGRFSLVQPGLPAAAANAPLASGMAAALPVPASTASDITPPAPVPQTMAQAAQNLPKPVVEQPREVAPLAAPLPVADAEPAMSPLGLATAFVKAHRKEAFMGGAASAFLLIILAVRILRRRTRDDSSGE